MKPIYGLILLFGFVTATLQTVSQIPENINSGDPAFPFPQFLDYGPGLKTLADENAPGMTHAEMEQRMRDAWQMICNNVAPYPDANAVVGGVQYLYPDPDAPIQHCTCVEADGYYLMGAALMADKTFFDGYYMWAHDRAFQGTQRFIDGEYTTPNYAYAKGLSGAGILGSSTDVYGGVSNNSATDGDVDVALALLMAYMQWGENSGIFIPSMGGKELNYKEEALNYIRAMVDTAIYPLALPEIKYTSGVVGFDGYLKGGDSQGELTPWTYSTGDGTYQGMAPEVRQQNYYYDYSAPAWFHEFRLFLEQENDNPFYINQYKRVEASCDWLMGLHYSKDERNIPYLGKVLYKGSETDFDFDNYIIDGEDFRSSWRTIMNYVWHGNPTYTWDPIAHQAVDGVSNTYEYDMAMRYAKFLKEPQSEPWNNPCRNIGDLADNGILFKGPYTLMNGYNPDGTVQGSFPLNWIHGTGAASAVVGQDFELMGEMFRHCLIAWDGEGYLDSRPTYFHEWFKLLGLLTLSGNFHAPQNMVPVANLKVYHDIDKTYGFTGDEVEFTVSFRNFGSLDAENTVVKFGIPEGFELISNDKGDVVADSIVWEVGTVPGYKTGGLDITKDSMKIRLKIGPEASGRYCTSARIFCSNGSGWTSNEYPNNQTVVMERNCIDVVKRALRISKTADREEYNPGQDIKYKIVFENSSDAGWINGGRQGVRLAFAHRDFDDPQNPGDPTAAPANELKFRLFHDASEPYIDYGNYRVSYFMNDPNIKCYQEEDGCTVGWGIQNTIAEGVDPALVTVFQEQIVPGEDEHGKWNQRIVLQFSEQQATITQHLQQYTGSPGMVHEGGLAPLRGVWRMFTSNYTNVDWTDDWSWEPTMGEDDSGIYFPIGDDYTDPDNLGLPVDSWHKSSCLKTDEITQKVLVEEWDGYVWRRVFGNGPSPGRDVEDVVVTDTLPEGVTFKNFIKQTALGVEATTEEVDGRVVVKWTIPKMQINMKDSLLFTAVVGGSCPQDDEELVNRAWIQGATESAVFVEDTVTVTCELVTICPESTSVTKTSDKELYEVGETVTYSINYKQTQGSIANPDLDVPDDWTVQMGSATNVTHADGKMTVTGENDIIVTHDYSYGTNTVGNGIEGTIQITGYSKSALAMRHTGGGIEDGIYAVIMPAYPTSIDIYNGTTLVESYTIPDQTPASIDFQIQMTDDKLEMWLATTPASFSGAPSIVVTDLPVQAGWFGVARGKTFGESSGMASLTSWKTHLDEAFDVVISDSIPDGIINVDNITESGVLADGQINWQLVSGKTSLPYGTEVTVEWEGEYDICDKVTNVVYVNTRGIAHNKFGNCYDINCAENTCEPPTSVVLSATKTDLCPEETIPFDVEVTPEEIYDFELFIDGESVGDVLVASEGGSYTVVATDASDPTCFLESDAVEITEKETPEITINLEPSYCAGETVELTATPEGGVFSGDAVTAGELITDDLPEGAADMVYYELDETTSPNGCPASGSAETSVVILDQLTADDVAASEPQGIYPPFEASGADPAADIIWIPVLDDGTLDSDNKVTENPFDPELTEPGEYHFAVIQKIDDCESEPTMVTYTISACEADVPVVADVEPICEGEPIPEFSATGTELYWFAEGVEIDNGNEEKTGLSFTAPDTDVGTHTYYVASYYEKLDCFSAPVPVALVINEIPQPEILDLSLSYCHNSGVQTITPNPSGGTVTINGIEISGTEFNPETDLSDGDNTFIYTVDENNCEGSIEYIVTRSTVPVPDVQTPQTWLLTDAPTSELEAIGTDIVWTGEDATEHTDNPFVPGWDTEDIYAVSVTQTIDGCTSDPLPVEVTVSNCGLSAPTVEDVTICEQADPIELTAQGVALKWYDDNGFIIESQTLEHSDMDAGEYIYYVSQTDNDPATGDLCESAKAILTVTINPTPKPEITDLASKYCHNSGLQSITPEPSGGILTINGDELTGTEFNPKTDLSEGDNSFIYTIEENNCEGSVEYVVTRSAVSAPDIQTPQTWLLIDAPAAELHAIGADIIWTDENGDKHTGNPFIPGWDVEGVYTVSVTQTVDGCTSDPLPVEVAVSNCGLSMPEVEDVIICSQADPYEMAGIGESLKWYDESGFIIQAQTLEHTDMTSGEYIYYISQTDNDPTTGDVCESAKAPLKLTVVETPVAELPNDFPLYICQSEGAYILETFEQNEESAVWSDVDGYISDIGNIFSFIPPASTENVTLTYTEKIGESCFHSVDVDIHSIYIPQPDIIQTGIACHNESNLLLEVTNVSASADYKWIINAHEFEGTSVDLDVDNYTVGTNAFSVTAIDENSGCVSIATDDEFVATKVAAPEITANKPIACFDDEIVLNYENAISNTFITYYRDEDLTDIVVSGKTETLLQYSVEGTEPDTYTYYAVVGDDCKSDKSEIHFEILAPVSAPIIEPLEICEGDDATLVASADGEIVWYNEDDIEQISNNGELALSNISVEEQYYAINKGQGGCTSEQIFPIISINHVPGPPFLSSSSAINAVCFGEPAPLFTAMGEEDATFSWYHDGGKTEGVTFSPVITETILLTQTVNGCESDPYSLPFVFNEEITVPDAIMDQKCEVERFELQNTNSENTLVWRNDAIDTWEIMPASILVDSDINAQIAYMIDHGAYECYSEINTITISMVETPSAPVPAQEEYISCFGVPVEMAVQDNGADEIVWRTEIDGSDFETTLTFLPKSSNLTAGEATIFYVLAKNGSCYSPPVSISQLMKEEVPVPFGKDTIKVCLSSQKADLYAEGINSSVVWRNNGEEIEGNSLMVEFNTTGNFSYYALSIDDHRCESAEKEFVLAVEEFDDFNLIADYSRVCVGNIVTVNSSYSGTIHWNAPLLGNIIDNSNNATTILFEEPGKEIVYAYDDTHPCKPFDTVHIYVSPLPDVNFSAKTINGEGLVEIKNNSHYESIYWDGSSITPEIAFEWDIGENGSPLYQGEEPPSTYSPFQVEYPHGPHIISLSADVDNFYGCEESIDKEIMVKHSNHMWIPNALTTIEDNPEGVKEFRVYGMNLAKYEISIYDNWGNLVWYSDKLEDGKPAECWYGKTKGNALKSDIFYWKINATFADGTKWKGVQKENGDFSDMGTIMLVR